MTGPTPVHYKLHKGIHVWPWGIVGHGCIECVKRDGVWVILRPFFCHFFDHKWTPSSIDGESRVPHGRPMRVLWYAPPLVTLTPPWERARDGQRSGSGVIMVKNRPFGRPVFLQDCKSRATSLQLRFIRMPLRHTWRIGTRLMFEVSYDPISSTPSRDLFSRTTPMIKGWGALAQCIL